MDGSATTSWQTLHADRQLRFDAAACLPLRYRAGGCSVCADSCPARVIGLQDETPEVAPDCLRIREAPARAKVEGPRVSRAGIHSDHLRAAGQRLRKR